MLAGFADDTAPVADDARARLILVDDHMILREGLHALLELESDFVVVGEAGNLEDGIALVERLRPNLVITDLAMPRGSGIQIISQVRAIAPETRVLVLTVHSSEEYIDAALKAGADGYVLKDSSSAELLQAIRSVIRGQRYLCPPVSAKIISGYLGERDARNAASLQLLTDREREILTLVAKGLSNKRIATRLTLSVKTVEKHRSNFMRKLELHNTAGITMFAISKRLVSSGEDTLHMYT
jgi:DNA-binding NarL/FixJ family response regulator